MSSFDFTNYSNEYLTNIDNYAKSLLQGKSGLTKDEVNSIFEHLDIKQNEQAQLNLDKIAGLDGDSSSFSLKELKTLVVLLDAYINKKHKIFVDGNLQLVEKTSGLVSVSNSDIVNLYKIFTEQPNNKVSNGKLDEEFGQNDTENCYVLAPLIALSKKEYGQQLISKMFERNDDLKYTKAFNSYIYEDSDEFQSKTLEAESNGDLDAAIISKTIRNYLESSGFGNGGQPTEIMYYIMTHGYLPAPAVIQDGKLTSVDCLDNEKYIASHVYEVDYHDSAKKLLYKEVNLKQVPLGTIFKIENYDASTLKTLKNYNDKFSIVCRKEGHVDAVGEIGDDYVIVYTTASSKIPVKLTVEEFLQTYNQGLIFMSVQ